MATPYRDSPPPPEDAIRSIRVATTLIERFRALIATAPTSVEELELRIGESQQIYPEIWRHLDDARRVLVTRGLDVGRVDELRRSELVQLGVTDVEITHELDMSGLILGRIRYTATKAASFNTGGVARAVEAARALMAALPEVDWVALTRAEDREIAAAGSMQARKWLGLVKVVAVAAALLLVVIVLARVTDGTDLPPPATRDHVADEPSAELLQFRMRATRIADLRATYAMTCDRAQLPELVALLRADGQPATAQRLETTPCTRVLPTCEHANLVDRLSGQLALVRDATFDYVCRGIVIGRPGAPQPALAIVIAGRGRDGKPHTFRGVVVVDGTREIVPFEPAPLPVFVGTGDLDGDARDELVMVGGTRMVVTRIDDGHFVDLAGPTMPAGCQANANFERGLREDGQPTHESLVIIVDDPHPRKGCPETGRHAYALAGQTVGEID